LAIINIVVAFPDAPVIKGILSDDDAFDVALLIGGDVVGTSGTLRAGRPFRPALIPFAIKNLLNEERCFGGGQPWGLAAASAWGRRPPSAGGGPTKYHRLAFRNSLHQVGIR